VSFVSFVAIPLISTFDFRLSTFCFTSPCKPFVPSVAIPLSRSPLSHRPKSYPLVLPPRGRLARHFNVFRIDKNTLPNQSDSHD
jgi:hypothetical protein